MKGRRPWALLFAFVVALLVHVALLLLAPVPVRPVHQVVAQSRPLLLLRLIKPPRRRPAPPHRHARLRRPVLLAHAHARYRRGGRAAGPRHRRAHAPRAGRPHIVRRRLSLVVPKLLAPRPEIASPALATASTAPGIGAPRVGEVTTAQGQSDLGGEAGTQRDGTGLGAVGLGRDAGEAPCGDPILENIEPTVIHDGVYAVRVRASIQRRNGSTVAEEFPYRFLYPRAEEDPFLPQNRDNPHALTLVQTPPPNFDLRQFSPVIREILRHTTPEGFTMLQPCTSPSPAASSLP